MLPVGRLWSMSDFRKVAVPDRYVTREATDHLEGVFGLERDPYCQDWEIELSDGSRLREFVDFYCSAELSDDERFALMALIVASAHDALDITGLDDGLWDVIHNLLVAGFEVHASMIHDWCCPEATNEDECFTLTPRMRAVWKASFGP